MFSNLEVRWVEHLSTFCYGIPDLEAHSKSHVCHKIIRFLCCPRYSSWWVQMICRPINSLKHTFTKMSCLWWFKVFFAFFMRFNADIVFKRDLLVAFQRRTLNVHMQNSQMNHLINIILTCDLQHPIKKKEKLLSTGWFHIFTIFFFFGRAFNHHLPFIWKDHGFGIFGFHLNSLR